MSVKLTPNGTHGAEMPHIPGPVMKVMGGIMTKMIELRGGSMAQLTTVGSKTGQERSVFLRYFPDGKDRWLVVASYGGSTKHPAWYSNLAKNPEKVWLKVGKDKLKVRAESLHGTERDAMWKKIVAEAPGYGDYQTKTDREIPVVRLSKV